MCALSKLNCQFVCHCIGVFGDAASSPFYSIIEHCMTDVGHTVALDFFVVSEHWPCLTLMPRNYRIFNNLRKLKIALDVDRDVIDGDRVADEVKRGRRNRFQNSRFTIL